MLIYATEQRSSGHAFSAIVKVRWDEDIFALVLQHHPVGALRWQSSFYQVPADGVLTQPLWQSRHSEAATTAIDALLEHIAHFGLPDDLFPLTNRLLPQGVIGAAVPSLA